MKTEALIHYKIGKTSKDNPIIEVTYENTALMTGESLEFTPYNNFVEFIRKLEGENILHIQILNISFLRERPFKRLVEFEGFNHNTGNYERKKFIWNAEPLLCIDGLTKEELKYLDEHQSDDNFSIKNIRVTKIYDDE